MKSNNKLRLDTTNIFQPFQVLFNVVFLQDRENKQECLDFLCFVFKFWRENTKFLEGKFKKFWDLRGEKISGGKNLQEKSLGEGLRGRVSGGRSPGEGLRGKVSLVANF